MPLTQNVQKSVPNASRVTADARDHGARPGILLTTPATYFVFDKGPLGTSLGKVSVDYEM